MGQTTMVKVIRINKGEDHMTNEQAQKVLDELQGVRPEKLNGEDKRLFEAIMKIADERDNLKEEVEKKSKQIERYQNKLVTNDLLHVIESQKKDEIIDLMLDEITNSIVNTCPLADYNYDLDCENRCNDNYKECWKKYFENKAKEVN